VSRRVTAASLRSSVVARSFVFTMLVYFDTTLSGVMG
jgi:hypothetical protein